MRTISTAAAEVHLRALIEKVNADRVAIEITSREGNAVLLAADEYNSMMETFHVLRSPANAERVLRSITALRAGGGTAHDAEIHE